MCSTVLLIAFMCINPFVFPQWVLLLAWIALVIDVIFNTINLIIKW